MRNKQYRIWDKELKRFSETAHIERFRDVVNSENYIVTQSIGITDDLGKLVFDRDIVKASVGGITGTLIIRWNNYYNGYRAYQDKERYGRHIAISDLDTIEVVGNVFENPELLEGEE